TTTTAPVAFDSGVFKQGQSFAYTFKTPGTYDYYCAVHPDMVGEIVVLDKDGKPVAPPAAPAKPANPVAALLAPFLPKAPAYAKDGNNPSPNGDGMSSMPNSTTPSTSSSPYPYAPAADPVSGAMNPFVAHVQKAHLSEGPGQNVQDIAEFDFWMKTH